jgi:hypothetical protein
MINQLLLGAITTIAVAIALIWLRFWRTTRDRFFLFFAAAFALISVVRLLLAVVPRLNEREPLIYGLNLLAMLLIVYAIIDKNRKAKPPGDGASPPRC